MGNDLNSAQGGARDGLAKIGSLWIDGALSWLEIASLQSFVETGHNVALYTYGKVPNVPAGVDLRDAREVWPQDDILIYKSAGSPALHADIFRVMMARQTGRVWVDTDVIALKPFDAARGWFLGHERDDRIELGNAVFGTPADSPLLTSLYDFLTSPRPIPLWLKPGRCAKIEEAWDRGDFTIGDMPWATYGPKALTYYAEATGDIAHAASPHVFFPVAFQERKMLVNPRKRDEVIDRMKASDSYSVHLYSRWMRKEAERTEGGYPSRDSWIGRWVSDHGVVEYPRAPLTHVPSIEPLEPPKDQDQIAHEKAVARAIEAATKEAGAKALEDLPQRKKLIPGGANVSPHGRVTIVTMAKDEGPYVLEWVAHHHVLGFTDIVAYTNDCTDGTDEMFDALASVGLVTRLDNPNWREKPPQSRALHWAEINPFIMGSEWLLVMDLDEFVSIKIGDHKVDTLIDEILHRQATGMCLTWRFFGSNGAYAFEDGYVTERLTSAAPDGFSKGYGIKTLFKADPHMSLAIHRPYLKMRFVRTPEGEAYSVDWLNGSGDMLDGKVLSWRLNGKKAGYDIAQMSHYGVKSREEYMLRRLRGDVLDNHSKYDPEYFGVFDRNEIEDRSALALANERDALIAKLLKIPAVRAAADLVEERRQAKLARLRQSDGFADEMAKLKSYSVDVAMTTKRK
ncbi:MAG: glycosyltransferase family 2 protein [Paracoccus sp. (in: a-proteobacteria)]